MNVKHIFVYGTLRKGQVNHYLLADMGASYVGDFATAKAYYMVGLRSLAYPYVIEDYMGKSGPVYGEVYSISEEGIAFLDRLEGHPHNYIREEVDLVNRDGELKAYMYILRNKELIDAVKKGLGGRFLAVEGNDWGKFVNGG